MAETGVQLRRWGAPALVGLAGLAVVLVGLVSGRGGAAGSGSPGSSLATVHDGAKAAYLLLERLGHKVERQTHPLRGFDKSQLAFYLAPQNRIDHADPAALARWIESGGTLVYGVSAFDPEAPAIAEALGLPELVIVPRSELSAPVPKPWLPARRLTLHAQVTVKETGADGWQALAMLPLPRGESLTTGRGEPVALQIDKGKGRIYVLDARVFSNAGLKQGDNALFLAVLAQRHAAGQPIAFDEYAHGFGEMAGVLQVAPWPLRWALWTGGLALLCYGLAIGRRLGAVSPAPRPAHRASIEQIETLATFFAVKKDRGCALAALAAWTGSPAPLVPPTDDSAFVSAARAMNPKGPRWP
jgi:hypothetical protein